MRSSIEICRIFSANRFWSLRPGYFIARRGERAWLV